MRSFEIEQKYRLRDPAAMRRRLKVLGAKKEKSGKEINEFFDRKASLRKKRIAMRLRRYAGQAVLTLKGPRLRSRFTKRMELEMSVDDQAMRRILVLAGFSVVMKYEKWREIYRLGKCHVTIDRLAKFGWFLEIEGMTSRIEQVAARLGFRSTDREKSSYLHMMFGYRH